MSHEDDGKQLSELIARVMETGIKNARIVDDHPDDLAHVLPAAEMAKLGWPARAISIAARARTTVEAIVAVSSFAAPGILVLAGEKGCGKTVACAWWAMRRPAGARFIRAGEFAAQGRYSADRKDIIASRSIVLDDLGTEYADDKG